MFPPIAEWFGQQTEAVKLAIIAFVTAFFGGLWSVLKEWRKPVLAAQSVGKLTSTAAPKEADDPLLLLLAAVEAINFNLVALLAATKENKPADLTRAVEELSDQLKMIEKEIGFTRDQMRDNKGK